MKKFQQDQHEFFTASSEPLVPPTTLMRQVQRDLATSPAEVFTKLAAIFLCSSAATLTVCPQFGVRLLGEGMGLMHAFMFFGTYGCLVACGAFFLGSAFFMAGLILRGEELRLLRRHRWLTATALTALALGFFLMISTEIVLGLAFAWFIGALLGGTAMLELSWSLRFRTA